MINVRGEEALRKASRGPPSRWLTNNKPIGETVVSCKETKKRLT